MSREVSVAEIPTLDLNHCLFSSIKEIKAIGVLQTYEARSVKSSKACSGSVSRIAYFCKAASRAASFIDILGAPMPDLLGNVGLLSRIILQLTAQEHNCTKFWPERQPIELRPWCTWVAHPTYKYLPPKMETPSSDYVASTLLLEVQFTMADTQTPREQLKSIRFRLGITTREVADFSQKIAEAEGNPEFHISNAWLTQVENSDSVPSIFKLYSLSSIYRIKFTDLLLLYGLDLQHLSRNQMDSPLPDTHLTNLEVYDQERTVSFPIRFDRSFDIDNTNLLSRLVEVWGEVPIALIQHLDIRHGLYGYIGLHDMTLYPCCVRARSCRLIPAFAKSSQCAGVPSSTGQFILWNFVMGTLAPGVSYRMVTCCCCPIRSRRAEFAGWRTGRKPKSSARLRP